MEKEEAYDLRGRQSSIIRLARFDLDSFVHMLFYRILVFAALLTAVVLVVNLLLQNIGLTLIAKVLVLIVWILFTPQLFSVFKAVSLVSTNGAVFGHLNEAFVRARVEKKGIYLLYKALPYAAMAFWFGGFVVLLYLWFA